MINKVIQFTAQVVDGAILEVPITMAIPCDKIKPIGMQTVNVFWKVTGCIVGLKVFLINVDGRNFGNKDFTRDSFMEYYYANCICCPESQFCFLSINGCDATVNGCALIYS